MSLFPRCSSKSRDVTRGTLYVWEVRRIIGSNRDSVVGAFCLTRRTFGSNTGIWASYLETQEVDRGKKGLYSDRVSRSVGVTGRVTPLRYFPHYL